MSDAGKAVFLSYASQDAEAAKRICDALRAAGVEVWFDQNELVGGDAWDQKIRKQIKECALLIPIISGNTQARAEGYFRLEWRLADQRTHLMGRSKAFLLPVTIDGTTDADADVPDSFVAVQWTKAPGGEVSAAFVARVQKLLTGGTVPPVAGGARPELVEGADPGSSVSAKAAGSTPPPTGVMRSRWLLPALVGVVAVLAAVGVAWWKKPAAPAAAAAPAPVASGSSPLVAKVRALLDDDPLMTRANVQLAEQLAREAVAAAPSDAEAHAALAWANFLYISENYEDTPERRAALREHAEKARLLAPEAANAELAMCGHLLVADSNDEAVSRLIALAARVPGNVTVLRFAAWAAIWRQRDSWGTAPARDPDVLEKLRAVSPQGAAYADTFAAARHWVRGEYRDADRFLDRVFAAGHPVRMSYLVRLLVRLYGWGDLPAARSFAETIPSQLLLEDVFIAHVSYTWLVSGEHDKALAVLERTPREFLQEARIFDPTAMLRGDVLAAAGRDAAAAVQWREALRVVEQRLAAKPADAGLLMTKAKLQASLGDRTGAAASFALATEITHPAAGSIAWAGSFDYFSRLGDVDAVLSRLDRLVNRDYGRWPSAYNALRLDPLFAAARADPRAQPILERGARWLAEMQSGGPANPPAAAPAADDKSVAVLAFANLSDDKANEYFSDGISEELLNALAKVPGLKVTARTSSFYFKGKETPIPEIAQKLGVAYVIEGSVRKQGDKVRITAQLIKASDGFHVWSDSFTRDMKDVFAVQDEIAALVAKNLSLTLGVGGGTAAANVSPEAFELYVQARQAWNLRNEEGLARAEQLLNRALAIAPTFARAHAALADVWYFQTVMKNVTGTFGRPNPPEFDRVLAKVREALALDPDSAEAHASLGNVLFSTWRYAEAEREYRRAIALNPNYASAHQWLGAVFLNDGRIGEAMATCQRASELDPLSSRIQDNLAYLHYFAGQYTTALALYDRALALQPSNYQAAGYRVLILATLGRSDEARAALRALPASLPIVPSLQFGIDVLAGRLREAEALYPAVLGTGVLPKSYLLLLLGRKADAVAALDAGAVDNPGSYLTLEYDRLDDDAGFQKFLATLGWTEARARVKAWRVAHPPERPATP